jgi:hypothetical protein
VVGNVVDDEELSSLSIKTDRLNKNLPTTAKI